MMINCGDGCVGASIAGRWELGAYVPFRSWFVVVRKEREEKAACVLGKKRYLAGSWLLCRNVGPGSPTSLTKPSWDDTKGLRTASEQFWEAAGTFCRYAPLLKVSYPLYEDMPSRLLCFGSSYLRYELVDAHPHCLGLLLQIPSASVCRIYLPNHSAAADSRGRGDAPLRSCIFCQRVSPSPMAGLMRPRDTVSPAAWLRLQVFSLVCIGPCTRAPI